MASGQTIFITYLFEGGAYEAGKNYGFNNALHCRYITKITTDSLDGKKVGLYFPPTTKFPFMASSATTNGTGYTVTGISALVQVVSGITDGNVTIEPTASDWRKYDLTDQLQDHVIGERISQTSLLASSFSVDVNNNSGATYTLDYLNYPVSSDEYGDNLSFGEETVFFGTVETDIRARVYSTDIPIVLPLSDYNTSTNPTWNGNEPVYVTEIAIYDDNGNQVAKAKLNFPIKKDSNVARTIVFGLDF